MEEEKEKEKNIGNEEIKNEIPDEEESNTNQDNEQIDQNQKSESYDKSSGNTNYPNSEENPESEDSEEEDSDDFDFGEEYDEEKVAKEKNKKEQDDEEYEQIKNELKSLNEEMKNNQRFPRVESKPEFASGVLNSETVKRVGNLKDEDIEDLLNKRKFYNFLKFIGWENVANERVFPIIQDIEDYSLSNKGKLLDSVFIDRAKQESLSYEKNPPKGGKLKDDR